MRRAVFYYGIESSTDKSRKTFLSINNENYTNEQTDTGPEFGPGAQLHRLEGHETWGTADRCTQLGPSICIWQHYIVVLINFPHNTTSPLYTRCLLNNIPSHLVAIIFNRNTSHYCIQSFYSLHPSPSSPSLTKKNSTLYPILTCSTEPPQNCLFSIPTHIAVAIRPPSSIPDDTRPPSPPYSPLLSTTSTRSMNRATDS